MYNQFQDNIIKPAENLGKVKFTDQSSLSKHNDFEIEFCQKFLNQCVMQKFIAIS